MASVAWFGLVLLLSNVLLTCAQYGGGFGGGYGGYGAPPYPIIVRNDNDDDGLRNIWPILLLLLFDGFGGCGGGFGNGGGYGGGCGGNGGSCGCQSIPIPYPIPFPINNQIVQ